MKRRVEILITVDDDDAVDRLRKLAVKHGWAVVRVHRGESQPGARPMLATAPEVVAEVVRLRDTGLSLRAVAADLNARGVAGAAGGRWWPRTVQAALRQARRASKGPRGG